MSEDEQYAEDEQGTSEAVPEQEDDGDTDAGEDDGEGEHATASWTDEPTATAEPPPTDNVPYVDWERRFTKAEQRFATYQKAILALWEDDAQHLTPFVVDPSAPLGFIDTRNVGQLPDDVKDSLKAFIGLVRERDYKRDPYTKTCDSCDGDGKTATGSNVPEYKTQKCPDCGGRGFTGGKAPVAAPAPANGDVEHFTMAEPAAADVPDADTWGQPRLLPNGFENPNYGKMPQYWIHVEPYGDTRNLGAQDAPAAT